MKKARRIMIGLKGMNEVVPLTDLACRFGAHGATLFLVHVIELPDITPLTADVPEMDRAAEKIVGAAKRIAQRAGVKVQTEIVRCHSAGAALLDEVKERKVDLLVLGAHRRRTLGEVCFGTTHDHLSRRARCAVLLLIPPK